MEEAEILKTLYEHTDQNTMTIREVDFEDIAKAISKPSDIETKQDYRESEG